MKKTLAILLALILALVNVAALAESTDANILKENNKTETYNNKDNADDPNNGKDVGTASMPVILTLPKVYEVNEADGVTPVVPDHTLVFTVAQGEIEENAAAEFPATDPSIANVKIEGGKGTITLTLPSYTAVGVYNYTITETNKDPDGKTVAGVQYPTETYALKVTVVQGEGLALGGITASGLVVAGVALRKGEAAEKLYEIENEYKAGSLKITKQVTGNMGDLSKEFDITVTFTPASGTTVFSDIACSGTGKVDGAEPATIEAGTAGWDAAKEITITLADDQYVLFDNIPSGVTYTVVEDDYTTEENGEYDDAAYDGNEEGTIEDAAIETVITNNKDIEIDTGVTVESVPYIMILAVVMIGAALLVLRKREEY